MYPDVVLLKISLYKMFIVYYRYFFAHIFGDSFTGIGQRLPFPQMSEK